jgi:two-component system chemotaxis response regulator CheB
MAKPNLIVIGASAGGLGALLEIVRVLTRNYPLPILIAVHTRHDGDSYLAPILSRLSRNPVEFATQDAPIEPGRILVAPPDFHMLVRRGRIHLNRGPRENGFRPAVDPLFRTAARVYRTGVMGIVLSGALDDGTYGMQVIAEEGGVTVVQDPEEASIPSMPLSVMKAVAVDHVLTAEQIGQLLASESAAPAGVEGDEAMARSKEPEPQNVDEDTEVREMLVAFGPPSGLTCPDCGGALWEIDDGKLVRYRCHVGHQFSPDGLDAEQRSAVEGALWSAVRVLEEHAELRRRMARRAADAGLETVSAGFDNSASETHRQAQSIRTLLFGRDTPEPPPPPAENSVKASSRKPSDGKRKSAKNRERGTRGRGMKIRRAS